VNVCEEVQQSQYPQ